MLSYGMPVEDIAPARKEDIARNRSLDLSASSNSTTTTAAKPATIRSTIKQSVHQQLQSSRSAGRTGSSRVAKEPQGESSTEPLLLLLPPPPQTQPPPPKDSSAKVRVLAHRGRLVASDVVNGNGAGDGTAMSKLAGLLKHTTTRAPAGGGTGRSCIKSSSSTAAGRSSSGSSSHTGNVYYNGYRAVNEDDDDDEEDGEDGAENEEQGEKEDNGKQGEEDEKENDKEKGKEKKEKQKEKEKKEKETDKKKEKENEKDSCNQQQGASSVDSHLNSINPRNGANPRPTLPLPTVSKFVLPAPGVMKPLNGNGPTTELSVGGGGGGSGDVSFGSDSNSPMDGAAAADCGAASRPKVINKLGKLPSKSVPLKRVSFGSSKGSMVETLVFETPTPLPEHAEREFFQSPAVLLGAGHTTVHSGGGASVQPGFPAAPGGASTPTPNQHPHPYPYHPQQHHPQHQQQHHHHHHHTHHYYSLDGAGGPTVGLGGRPLDDSGIELQEEVERSKVRVSFFQSSKPQSISPPELLHLYGGGVGQNLIYFGDGGGVGGGDGSSECYVNNNSTLDTYITSAALNQQFDSLPGHQQPPHPHPDHWDPSMAAFYGTGTAPPPSAAYNRQMSTESGWDNPFRPGGDLSREADEIVNLIKGGKPITPTGDQSLVNGDGAVDGEGTDPTDSHTDGNGGTTIVDGVVTKDESVQLQSSQQNGTKSPHKTRAASGGSAAVGSPATAATKNGAPTADGSMAQTPISNQVIPGPQSASHVVIDEKKKKKCTCCVIQ